MNARSAALSATSVLVLLLAGCGGGGSGSAPADDAAKLVPGDALVYVHVSSDRGRNATKDGETLAKRFAGYESNKDALVTRLNPPGCKVDMGSGKEVALALVDTGGNSAGSLVLVDTGSDKAIKGRTCGAVVIRKIGKFVVIGQAATIRMAQQLHDGKGTSLASNALYAKETGELPKDRVADAWVTKAGVTRLLTPQGGLLGIAGTLLDQPTLKAAAASLGADGSKRAKLVVQTALTKPVGKAQSFEPTLQKQVPAGTTAFLGLNGVTGAVSRLLPALTSQGAALEPLLRRAGADLAPLASIFSGQVGVAITSAKPAPILTLTAPITDEAQASRTLANARPTIAKLLKPAKGATPTWKQVDGAWQLKPASGIEIDYAVLDGRVAVSTKLAGIVALRRKGDGLADSSAFKSVEPGIPDRVSSIVFLDFNQLLSLGEQGGLNDSAAYRQVKADLKRIRAVGARTSGDGDETTAELYLSIP